MMRWIIGSSMRLRLVVVAIGLLTMVFGIVELGDLRLEDLPEFSRPYVEIQTEALGLSAQEVEAMITTPMEADMLNGTPWVEEIRSQSLPGLSSIVLVFEKGTDIMRARQVVQENLTEVFALPNVSKPPTMINPVSSASRVMEIGLTSDTLSLIEMSVLARWTIAPRLMGLPDVANVSIWGQRKRQLQVLVDPEQLRDDDVTLLQVIKTAGNALWASPLSFLEASTPGTGGWIDTPNQRLGVRHLLPISTAEELARVPLEGDAAKRLGDVATVVEDHQPLIGDAFVNDAPALMLVVQKFPWATTTEVTQQVEEALADLAPGLTGLEMDSTLFRPATYLELAAGNVSTALLIGAALIVIALFAFFHDWRSAFVATLAIFLSMLVAGTVLDLRGAEVNSIVLAGFILALGALIDDAVIDVENGRRRLRRDGGTDKGKSSARILFEATLETRSPIVYATLILVLAVMPVLFLEGLSGAFYWPLATSYLLALLASMVVALTITPALSVLLLRNRATGGREASSERAGRGLRDLSFLWAGRLPRAAFLAIFGVVWILLLVLPFEREGSLLPKFKETDLLVRWNGTSGTSHPAMSRIIGLASRELRAVPGVRNVSAHVGRAIMSDKRTNVDAGEIWVSIDPTADYDQTVAAVRGVVAGYPGLSREVLTYLQAKVREELSGTGESLVVRVYGEDLNVVRQKADEVEKVLAGIDGIVDARVNNPPEVPSLEVRVDLERAKLHGLKPGDVRRSATTLMGGIQVGNLFEEQKVFDVVVFGTPETRHSVTSLENLWIDAPSGDRVRLKEVADVRIVPAATVIHRDAVARRIDVTAAVEGRDVAAVAADVERGIQGIDFPLEYRAELLGEYADRLAALDRVRAFGIAAVIGIFLLLQAFFRSWRLAAAVFVTLPMPLLGGILIAFLVGGGVLSLGTIAGLLAVFGLAVRNGILLISRYRQLEEEGEAFSGELVQRGTQERSTPILMTAVTVALAFLPLTFFGDVAGLEILQPMAIVVLGGLITSTLFSLVVVPGTYLLFGAEREAELELQAVTAGAEGMDIASGATPAGS